MPVLIVVLGLSFSVRFAGLLHDMSPTPGVAYAGEEKKDKDNEKGSEKTDKSDHKDKDNAKVDKGTKLDPSKDSKEKDTMPLSDVDTSKWRDPGDEAPGYKAVQREVADDLASRRVKLEEREQQLNTREALLKAAEKERKQKYKELSQLRGEIENLLGKQSEEEKARIASLVKVYEGMKPKDAARIFDTLDLDILVAVVSKMSERKLSPVLAAMDPERARTVTIMLAEQNKLPSLP